MVSSRNMRVRAGAAAAGLVVAGVALSGCHTVGGAISNAKLAPDEFRVVTKAPLVVPPEYALRPPTPGEPRPQELQPESQARQALLGQREAINRSEGEVLLANRAGAAKADPLIRYVVDDQYGDIAHKEKPFADRVMFWRRGQPQVPASVQDATAAAENPAPLDPAVVQKTVAALTGDKAVVIQRAPEKKKFKLPGL
ncbi:MAG: DUF3035 domain-containing protein [Caulobacteraceae bacterium]